MKRRFTISGLEHMIKVLHNKPELMALASLAPLQLVADEAKAAAKACGCNAGKVYKKYKGTFEVALGNLQHGDHLIMKRLLNLDEICYYVKEDGNAQPKIKCI